MSGKPRRGGFAPSISEQSLFSIAQFKDVLSIFQQLTQSPELKWGKRAVYAAGIAAVVDIAHNLCLAARYIWKL